MKASSRMAHPKPDGCGNRIHDRSGHRAVLRARARRCRLGDATGLLLESQAAVSTPLRWHW
jgi:hypothetical protein